MQVDYTGTDKRLGARDRLRLFELLGPGTSIPIFHTDALESCHVAF